MVRRIPTEEITKHVKEMCIEANHYLSKDMEGALAEAEAKEQSPLGRKILCQLQENLQVARIRGWRWFLQKLGRKSILKAAFWRMLSMRGCDRAMRKGF